jgi:transcriptional regulator with XRE-family HTH domain
MTPFSEMVMRMLRATMDTKNISQRELAGALGVSEARVSQMFAEGSNLTLKSVDEIQAAFVTILVSRPLDNFIFVDPK